MKPPSCDQDVSKCRITRGETMVNLTGPRKWPVFDGAGNQVNAEDPNAHIVTYTCTTCGKRWSTVTEEGQTALTEHA